MTSMRDMVERIGRWPRERLAERLSAACYGTVLVMVALAAIDEDEVSTGLGWELVTGVGVATWIAHLFAEVVGDRVRLGSALDRSELTTAMTNGLPIPLAAVPPAVVLLLGRLEILDEQTAVWVAVAVAFVQLVGVGAVVGSAVASRGLGGWSYPALTACIGIAVVILKVALGH